MEARFDNERPDPPAPAEKTALASDPGGRRPTNVVSNLLSGLQRQGEVGFVARYALLGVWILLGVLFTILVGSQFLSHGTVNTVFGTQEPLVFLGMAAVIVLSVGEFDLSIASLLGLSATLVPVLVVNHGWSPLAASLLAIGAAGAAGAVNAYIIVVIGIDAIVVTLGMATLLAGLASKFSDNTAVGGLSTSFATIANTQVAGLPITFFYGIGLVLAVAYVMRFTALGRHMGFVASNREVARLAGVRVTGIRIGAYIASGLICGTGGVFLAASVGGFDSTTSSSYLLPALSATFLGTAVIRPGKFNPIGTFIGIYLLATGIVGLELVGASGWITDVFYGAGLVLAVVIATLTRRRTLRA